MTLADILHETQAHARHGLVIIDGNNFLYSQSPRYGDHRDPDFPSDQHQAALLADVLTLLSHHSSLRIDLWFDGPVHAITSPHPQCRVIQSGGKGKNRADRGILAFLRAASLAGELQQPPLVITKDKELGKRSRRYGTVL